jgi:hypothetical protein
MIAEIQLPRSYEIKKSIEQEIREINHGAKVSNVFPQDDPRARLAYYE